MNQADEILSKLNSFEEKLLGEYYSDYEYKEMLFATGISEREYQILQTSLNDYLSRAKQFAKRSLTEDTLKQLKSAQIISPNNYEVNFGLANCYFAFWQKTKERSFKSLAERHIQFCLNIKPADDAAADLFKSIRTGKVKSEKIKNKDGAKGLSKFISWLMVKDKKGEHSRLYTAIAIALLSALLIFFVIPMSIMDNISASEAQKLSVELEKKYERINQFILDEDIENAQKEIINLVHPSTEPTEIYPKGVFSLEPYSYNEYWKMKREELNQKIEAVKRKND